MNHRIAVATFVAAGLLSGCGKPKEAAQKPAVAGPATIRDAVRLSGTMQPLDSVNIKSEVSGQIVRVYFREGDRVKRGQIVAQIDSSTFILARDKSALDVDRCQLVVSTAKRDLQRAKALAATGSVSADRIEDLDVAVQKAELDLRGAKLMLSNSVLDLVHTSIRAPMDGRLIVFPTVAGMVASSATGANGGTSLGTIADPSRLKVVVEVGELDYVRLKLAMPVEISTENGKPRKGHVSFVPSSARQSNDTKTIKVFPVEVVLDDDASGLLPGMTVGVNFVFLERRAEVAVPYEAIKGGKSRGAQGAGGAPGGKGGWPGRRGGDSNAKSGADSSRPEAKKLVSRNPDDSGTRAIVMVRRDGKIQPTPVLIGATDYRRTEILDGLAAGDTVWIPEETATSASAAAKGGPGGPPGGGR